MKALEIIFWLLAVSGVYATLVYPVLMFLLGRIASRHFHREAITPPVSLIVSAFNEEASIRAKIENSLEIDYPPDKLEIIVASDGSTDRTDEIVREFADRGVRLLRFEGGLGKSAVINRVVSHATGDILAFSDATGMWNRSSVSLMVSHFADPSVGCVSGRVAYSYDHSAASQGFGVYQRYVLALRRAEGAFGTGFNASGSIHAMRRSLFVEGPPETFMDMIDPLHVAMRGFRTTFEDEAVSMEQSRGRTSDEFRARMRIGLRAWSFMAYAVPRLPILRSPMYCFQVISHKFLRWLIGPSLIGILVLDLALLGRGGIYVAFFLGQLAYYGLTVAGWVLGRAGIKVPGLPALVFFNSTNLAYVFSLFQYLRGTRMARWVPAR